MPFLDIHSGGRSGPKDRFSLAQIEQIQRTVRRAPEVMVKVTGGGRKISAVASHVSYISQDGELKLETDEGDRITKEEQKDLLDDWHLELSAGQYRRPPGLRAGTRGVKLVHNIVLSMPAPTPPDKVMAAAKIFAREKFGLQHRYVMALHTHQHHPHVHLVVKAEDELGCHRLHIDKEMLREWREDFARYMRDQGIAANATACAVRGQGKRRLKDAIARTQRRGNSYWMREKVESMAAELFSTRTINDPARAKLNETRKTVLRGWFGVADALDAQGEVVLAGDVRYFARHLPPVRTDRERLAEEFIRHLNSITQRSRAEDQARHRQLERFR